MRAQSKQKKYIERKVRSERKTWRMVMAADQVAFHIEQLTQKRETEREERELSEAKRARKRDNLPYRKV